MKFNQALLAEINNKCNIVELISKYTTLKNNGNSYVGLCPFHSEKSPSFFVNELKKIYHCFGCGVGGNIITFFMNIENMSYQETILYLADYYNIEYKIKSNIQKSQNIINEEKILSINLKALLFFKEQLKNFPLALNYLRNRKIFQNSIDDFDIGYAPNNDDLLKYLLNTYNLDDILLSGLISINNNNPKLLFKNRIIFPIKNHKNNVLGFGGRTLNSELPKYLNSKENIVFKKKYLLYTQNKVFKTKNKYLILVEGYLDVISLYSQGFYNVISSLGTSVTIEQLQCIKKYSNNLIIIFDNDIAGKNSVINIINKIVNIKEFNVKIAEIHSAKDPDEFIHKYGAEKFKILLKSSCHYIQFKIENIKLKYKNLEDINNKYLCLKEILEFFSYIQDPIEKELYLKKVSYDFNINLKKFSIDNINKKILLNNKEKITKFTKAEEYIINILLSNNQDFKIKKYIDIIKDEFCIINDYIKNAINKNIFNNILLLYEQKNNSVNIFNLEKILSKEEMQHLIKITTNTFINDLNVNKIFNDCIFLLKSRYYKDNNLLQNFINLNIKQKNLSRRKN